MPLTPEGADILRTAIEAQAYDVCLSIVVRAREEDEITRPATLYAFEGRVLVGSANEQTTFADSHVLRMNSIACAIDRLTRNAQDDWKKLHRETSS